MLHCPIKRLNYITLMHVIIKFVRFSTCHAIFTKVLVLHIFNVTFKLDDFDLVKGSTISNLIILEF